MKLTVITKLTDTLRDTVLKVSSYMKLHLGYIPQFIHSIQHRARKTSLVTSVLFLIILVIHFWEKVKERKEQAGER